jgi:predicted ester cyclase
MNNSKTFIGEYFEALSGKPKTREMIAEYVADEALTLHILETEAAFPDYQLVAEDVMAEGDKVVVRGMLHARHMGSFAGIPPTGKTVKAGLIIIYQVQDRKIVNHWIQFDAMAFDAAVATRRGCCSLTRWRANIPCD